MTPCAALDRHVLFQVLRNRRYVSKEIGQQQVSFVKHSRFTSNFLGFSPVRPIYTYLAYSYCPILFTSGRTYPSLAWMQAHPAGLLIAIWLLVQLNFHFQEVSAEHRSRRPGITCPPSGCWVPGSMYHRMTDHPMYHSKGSKRKMKRIQQEDDTRWQFTVHRSRMSSCLSMLVHGSVHFLCSLCL